MCEIRGCQSCPARRHPQLCGLGELLRVDWLRRIHERRCLPLTPDPPASLTLAWLRSHRAELHEKCRRPEAVLVKETVFADAVLGVVCELAAERNLLTLCEATDRREQGTRGIDQPTRV